MLLVRMDSESVTLASPLAMDESTDEMMLLASEFASSDMLKSVTVLSVARRRGIRRGSEAAVFAGCGNGSMDGRGGFVWK
jgi:hypothetical protein